MEHSLPKQHWTRKTLLLKHVENFSRQLWRLDRVVLAISLLLLAILVFDRQQVIPSILFSIDSLIWISPFLILSVATAAAAKASGADAVIAGVFSGHPVRMIFLASLFGALSPFCSCGVVPIIAGLLSAGVPLAPVMAFWISSPLMDPEMFILSAATLGLPFTIAKTIATIAIGLLAGFATHAAMATGAFSSVLRVNAIAGCGPASGCDTPEQPQWVFWRQSERLAVFRSTSLETGWFLLKWLTFAFVLESLMTVYIPAEMVVQHLGSGEWWTIPAAALASIPAYLNGYAAIPLMSRLMEMGMAPGAAMGFLLGGGVTSIPAAIAVYVLARPAVFVWYILLAMVGSISAAMIYQLTM